MKIDVWADVSCPFCYLGTTQLRQALAQLPVAAQVQVRHHSFQLDPNAPRSTSETGLDALARKFGRPVDDVRAMTQNTEQSAAAEGLIINHDAIVPVNTFDAHRLVHFATGYGLQTAMLERLYLAYFTNGEDVADLSTLKAAAAEVGLDADKVHEMLVSDAFIEVVQYDVQQAAELGVTGVPFFVFDRSYGLSGAQGTDTIRAAIEQVWNARDDGSPQG